MNVCSEIQFLFLSVSWSLTLQCLLNNIVCKYLNNAMKAKRNNGCFVEFLYIRGMKNTNYFSYKYPYEWKAMVNIFILFNCSSGRNCRHHFSLWRSLWSQCKNMWLNHPLSSQKFKKRLFVVWLIDGSMSLKGPSVRFYFLNLIISDKFSHSCISSPPFDILK